MNRSIRKASTLLVALASFVTNSDGAERPFGSVNGSPRIATTFLENPVGQPCYSILSLNLWEDPAVPGAVRLSGSLAVYWDYPSGVIYSNTYGFAGTGTRSGGTIEASFNTSAPDSPGTQQRIGTITLTQQGSTQTWDGTIDFDLWRFWGSQYQRLTHEGGGDFTLTQIQSQQYAYWVNKIDAWKADMLPLADSIRALEKDYVDGAAKYRILYKNFPPVFDKVYKIKLDPTGKRGIILKRGSGRAALIDLNDAFLTFTKVYSKVKLGGKALTEIVKLGTLKTETMVKIGLTVYDIPKDKLTAIAYIDKLAIRFGSAYRPLKDLRKDEGNYSYDRSKAIKAMTLMNTNLLRIRDFGIKARNGIKSEGEDLATEIEADTLLTEDEKTSLKFGLGVVIVDLTN